MSVHLGPEYAIVPVMANGNGSTPTSNEVNIEVHALIIEELPRINIVPGEVAKVTVRNLGSDPTLRSVELLASPEDALGICGLKASMSTFGPSGIYEILLPTGAPVSLDQNFKAGKGLKDAVN